jgi:hypothetical protein
VSSEICSFAQEEETPGSIDWQLQQNKAKAKMMARKICIGVITILNQSFPFFTAIQLKLKYYFPNQFSEN